MRVWQYVFDTALPDGEEATILPTNRWATVDTFAKFVDKENDFAVLDKYLPTTGVASTRLESVITNFIFVSEWEVLYRNHDNFQAPSVNVPSSALFSLPFLSVTPTTLN